MPALASVILRVRTRVMYKGSSLTPAHTSFTFSSSTLHLFPSDSFDITFVHLTLVRPQGRIPSFNSLAFKRHLQFLSDRSHPSMCIQVVERYSVCRCLYYRHAIDPCSSRSQRGHKVEERTVLVGYTCSAHSACHMRPGVNVATRHPRQYSGVLRWRVGGGKSRRMMNTPASVDRRAGDE